MDDMKECAHCGGKPIRRKESGDERDGYANRVEISCINCGASVRASGDTSKGGYADNSTVDARAIAAWNRRAVPQANAEQDALLERERRDAQSLASLLVKERRRFEFLHSTNCDAEGWEWGVARVRRNAAGQIEHLWGLSDHSDIDAAIRAASKTTPSSGEEE